MQSELVTTSLRRQIARIEGAGRRRSQVLPFGLDEVDARLPGGGLSVGALHEVAAGGPGAADGAAAALFSAGLAARTRGRVLWCTARRDLFAPAIAQAGLGADRTIHVEAGDDRMVLACMEEGLRHGGLGAVVGEVARLPGPASRRLQLVAEATCTLAIALCRWRQAGARLPGAPSLAASRWRVSARPSAPLPVAGVGRARWQVELVRVRAGERAFFELEACDGTGRLALPAELVHRPGAAQSWWTGASA